MIFILLLLSSVALIGSLVNEDLALTVICIGLLLTLIFSVWHDISLLRAQLKVALRTAKNYSKSLPLLSSTGEFSDLLGILIARINNLENEVALVSAKKSTIKKNQTENWLVGTLQQIADRFQGAAVAIVLPQGDTIRCGSSLNLGKRFEGQLLGLTQSWLERGDTYSLGVRDALADKGFWGDFSMYGYVGYSMEPLTWSNHRGQEVRGALWVGFKAGREITRTITDILSHESRTIEAEIAQRMQLAFLEERAKQAEERSENKSEFITHMSHDLRSPLNNVRAIFHLLQNEEQCSPESKDYVRAGLLSCENASEMLETLLDYSKLRAGKLEARFETESLYEILSQSITTFEVAASSKRLTLQLTATEEDLCASVDKRQLKRVLFNLISNAVKYTEAGSISLILRRNEEQIELVVQDTGRGMTQSQLGKLFKPFERLANDAIEGAGIGLVLTKALVELNRGVITVESTVALGTSVTLRFAAMPGPAAVAKQFVSVKKENVQQTTPADEKLVGTVLLVDDDIESSNSLKKLLERIGLEVMVASGVKEALSITSFQKPDVIISDVRMPDGGGERLLDEIKERYENLPLLLLTGERASEKLSRLVSRGAKAVLEKPLDFSSLKSELRKVLNA